MAFTSTANYRPTTAAGWELYLMRMAPLIHAAEKHVQRLHEWRGAARLELVRCQKAEGITDKARNHNH